MMKVFPIIALVLLFSITMTLKYTSPYFQVSASISNNGNYDLSNLIYNSSAHPFNLPYSNWTENWWKWTYSIPWEKNPSYDNSGIHCAENQEGPVWFLTSSFEHPTNRTCELPSNTAILTTLLNSECSFAEFKSLKTEQQLRECAKDIQDAVTGGQASLDGRDIPKNLMYRVQTDIFNFTLPVNNILNLTAQTTQSVADGTWLFLKPLSPGIHVLKIKGEINSTTFENSTDVNQYNGPLGWNQTTTYNLIVK